MTTTSTGAAGGGAGGSACTKAAECGALGACGPWVLQEQVAKDLPAGTGGPLADGTYDLDAYTVYTGPGGATGPLADQAQSRATLVIKGGTFLLTNALMTMGMAPSIRVLGGTYTTAQGDLSLGVSCPVTTTLVQPFTTTGTTVRLYLPDGNMSAELEFKKN